jgi:transcriptional regulator with XRE-family HTH domain
MLGQVIQEARLRQGMTQMALSFALSKLLDRPLNPNYISQIESGRNQRPDKERLRLLAQLLDLDSAELFRLADYAPEVDDLGECVWLPIGDTSAGPGVWEEALFPLPRSAIGSRQAAAFRSDSAPATASRYAKAVPPGGKNGLAPSNRSSWGGSKYRSGSYVSWPL